MILVILVLVVIALVLIFFLRRNTLEKFIKSCGLIDRKVCNNDRGTPIIGTEKCKDCDAAWTGDTCEKHNQEPCINKEVYNVPDAYETNYDSEGNAISCKCPVGLRGNEVKGNGLWNNCSQYDISLCNNRGNPIMPFEGKCTCNYDENGDFGWIGDKCETQKITDVKIDLTPCYNVHYLSLDKTINPDLIFGIEELNNSGRPSKCKCFKNFFKSGCPDCSNVDVIWLVCSQTKHGKHEGMSMYLSTFKNVNPAENIVVFHLNQPWTSPPNITSLPYIGYDPVARHLFFCIGSTVNYFRDPGSRLSTPKRVSTCLKDHDYEIWGFNYIYLTTDINDAARIFFYILSENKDTFIIIDNLQEKLEQANYNLSDIYIGAYSKHLKNYYILMARTDTTQLNLSDGSGHLILDARWGLTIKILDCYSKGGDFSRSVPLTLNIIQVLGEVPRGGHDCVYTNDSCNSNDVFRLRN